MDTPAPDYQELTDALAAAGVPMSAAEVHGIIAGACCAAPDVTLGGVVFGRSGMPAGADGERLLTLLTALHEDTQRRLDSLDFDFEPLLPADASPVEALGDWARGFVFGLTAGAAADPTQLPGEAGEFVRDALSIGEIEADGETGDGQAREIVEVVEYLRVGVQVVYEELRATDA